jgi:hypothetical protein
MVAEHPPVARPCEVSRETTTERGFVDLKGTKQRRRTRSRKSDSEKHELFAYDGLTCIGRIVTKGRSARAFNAAGGLIGKFSISGTAFRAISEAYLSANKARPAALAGERNNHEPELRGVPA